MAISAKTISGAIWTIGGSIGSRIIGLTGTLLLTRFLLPEVVGEVGVASVLVLTAFHASSFGLGQYVVNKPKSGREVAFHATFYWMILGVIAIALVVLLRDQFAPLFNAPTMARYVPGLGLAMLMDRIAYMPERILARELRFRSIAATRSAAEVVYAIMAVVLAWAGLGGDAVVIANILQSLIRLVIFVAITPRREWLEPCRIQMKHTLNLFRYGVPISIGVLAGFAGTRWDNLLFSRFFGPGPMALYNQAYNLASVPATTIGEQIGDVLNPSFARMEMEERKDSLVRATAFLGLIVFPLAVGLGAVAPSLVPWLLAEKWHGVAPLLMVLSVMSIVRPISWNIFSFLLTCDRPRLVMILEVGRVVALLTAVSALARYGELWACIAVGLVFSFMAFIDVLLMKWLFQIPVMGFIRGAVEPLLACAPMAAAVIGVRYGMEAIGVRSPGLQTIVGIVVGAVVYVPSAFVLAGGITRELVGLVRQARQRRRGGDDAPGSSQAPGSSASKKAEAPSVPPAADP